MGGQQFGSGTTLIDIRSMNDVLRFDQQRGIIEVESGMSGRADQLSRRSRLVGDRANRPAPML
jgi:hypothetical protein